MHSAASWHTHERYGEASEGKDELWNLKSILEQIVTRAFAIDLELIRRPTARGAAGTAFARGIRETPMSSRNCGHARR